MIRIVWICFVFGFTGCATLKQSMFLGVTTGAVTGLALGSVIDRRGHDAMLSGALIGAAVGGVTSYFIHKGLEDRDAKTRKETLFNLDKFNVSKPSSNVDYDYGIAAPSVETECFDTEVKGDKLVQAHCESRILGTPEWVKNQGQKRKQNNDR